MAILVSQIRNCIKYCLIKLLIDTGRLFIKTLQPLSPSPRSESLCLLCLTTSPSHHSRGKEKSLMQETEPITVNIW